MTEDLFDPYDKDGAPSGIVLRVRVHPGAGRASVTGRHGDALAMRVAAPPLGGRANAECAEFVADLLGVRKSQVELVSGERSRTKRLRVEGIDPKRARSTLELELERVGAQRGSQPGAAKSHRSTR